LLGNLLRSSIHIRTKIIAARHFTRLENIPKVLLRPGAHPKPHWGAYNPPQTSQLDLGATLRREEKEGKGGEY